MYLCSYAIWINSISTTSATSRHLLWRRHLGILILWLLIRRSLPHCILHLTYLLLPFVSLPDWWTNWHNWGTQIKVQCLCHLISLLISQIFLFAQWWEGLLWGIVIALELLNWRCSHVHLSWRLLWLMVDAWHLNRLRLFNGRQRHIHFWHIGSHSIITICSAIWYVLLLVLLGTRVHTLIYW